MKSPTDYGSPSSVGHGVTQEITVNPNLLRWTEVFDNAVWAKTDVTVNADATLNPPGDQTTADEAVFGASGILAQTSATAGTGSLGTFDASVSTSYDRFSVSRILSGTTYTFSVYMKTSSGTATVRLELRSIGGFVAVRLVDTLGAGPSVVVWGAQLEVGAAATAYAARTT